MLRKGTSEGIFHGVTSEPEIYIKGRGQQGCVLSPCLFDLRAEKIFGAINFNKLIKIGGTINKLIEKLVLFKSL